MSPQLSANVKRTDSYFDENLTVIEVATQSCAGVEGRVSNESSIAPAPVPDNMLYNIGLDSAGTDLVCLSPSNAIFHPSDALIFENQLKAQKVMKRIGDELPIALVVPLYYALHWGREPTAGESDRNRTLNPGVRGKEGGVDQRGGQSRPLSQHGDANITASSSSEALPSVHYFPYPSSHRASQQSKRLQKPFRATSSRPHSTQDLVEVPFNAQVQLSRHRIQNFSSLLFSLFFMNLSLLTFPRTFFLSIL